MSVPDQPYGSLHLQPFAVVSAVAALSTCGAAGSSSQIAVGNECWDSSPGSPSWLRVACCDGRLSAESEERAGCFDGLFTFERCCTVWPLRRNAEEHEDNWRSWTSMSGQGDWYESAEYFGTDQGRLFSEFLPLLFEPRRLSIKHILEVGFYKAQSALHLLHYFPRAFLVSIDPTDMAQAFFDGALGPLQERAYLVNGTQTDDNVLCSAVLMAANKAQVYGAGRSSTGFIDLVLDDGSHWPADQMYTFRRLFGCVAPGGIYVVEDTFTSYWSSDEGGDGDLLYGYSYRNMPFGLLSEEGTMAYFERMAKFVNSAYKFLVDPRKKNQAAHIPGRENFLRDLRKLLSVEDLCIARQITSISFVNQAVVITKAPIREPDAWEDIIQEAPFDELRSCRLTCEVCTVADRI
eukprot:gnl/TRDRNA2_/TRDRNA2_33036_c0_seq1.p1 gnl/TRDRNA2_/TRDRNA2_33036_c0~~gnl/TRDRNA2_/TRDRNA2_33036_c0_seq1.p1  ORF type:complete len:406 (-),score=48.05 gnl/TRDRNA2_/TRDRNA2_33036_c0_seq1:14-1231(-)